MKKSFLLLLLLLVCRLAFTQTIGETVDSLIKLGISFHDERHYSEAISRFEKALDLDKNSTRAQYELANTLVAVGRFDDAIKQVDRVIKADKEYVDQAYVLKGTAYDMQNEPEKAIKTYRKGLEKHPEEHMLWFNLSVTLVKNKDYKEGEKAALKAVGLKSSHPGSNQLLGYANYYQARKSKTLLPLFHFLILENKSKRAGTVYKIAAETLGSGVEKKDNQNINISLNIGSEGDDPFSAADLALGLSTAAQISIPDSVVLDGFQKMAKLNAMFFEILPSVEKKGLDNVYSDYLDLFADLHQKGHTEAFTYWVSRASQDDKVKEWMKNNEKKVDDFVNWYNSYHK
jgi:tetratricopeptide (TPR) repeat protein